MKFLKIVYEDNDFNCVKYISFRDILYIYLVYDLGTLSVKTTSETLSFDFDPRQNPLMDFHHFLNDSSRTCFMIDVRDHEKDA